MLHGHWDIAEVCHVPRWRPGTNLRRRLADTCDTSQRWEGAGWSLRSLGQWLTHTDTLYAQDMRDRDTIDSELRRLAAMRRSIRAHGGEPLNRLLDELLDERLGHPAETSGTEAGDPYETKVAAEPCGPFNRTRVLRRLSLLAALPLSVLAIAAALVVMLAVHNPHPAAQPTAVPPSGAPPRPPPPSARPNPVAPKNPAPPLDVAERAFIEVLKQQGVPVPDHEYVKIHGHGVCDFLANRPNFAEAVRFVQQSSIWDATESAKFAAGAIVSYCPQYEPTDLDEMQQDFRNTLAGVQAIQRDLEGIRDDLEAIPGQIPGQ
jgi:hypothetical protein